MFTTVEQLGLVICYITSLEGFLIYNPQVLVHFFFGGYIFNVVPLDGDCVWAQKVHFRVGQDSLLDICSATVEFF